MTAGELLEAAQSFPVSSLKQRLGEGGLVVVAPHPDDESSRVRRLDRGSSRGGPAHTGRGRERRNRVSSRQQGLSESATERSAENEARQAVTELGLDTSKDIEFLRLPDRFVPDDGPFAETAIERIVASAQEVGAAALFVSRSATTRIATIKRPTVSRAPPKAG